MPKNIENVKEKILKSAEDLLLKKGLKTFTLRAVATECHIAVGTIYNYFPSKDMILAEIMLADWMQTVHQTKARCTDAPTVEAALEAAFEEVSVFTKKFSPIWAEYATPVSFGKENFDRHKRLVTQLAECFAEPCRKTGRFVGEEERIFLAENLLLCLSGKSFSLSSLLNIIHTI